jgi:N-acetylmuramoyl-L-alanine amidase
MTSRWQATRGQTSIFRDLLSSGQFTLNFRRANTVGVLGFAVALSTLSFAAPSGSPAVRKQQARTQFETAERMREALNGRAENERTRKDYQKVADAYRKVYYVSPASSKADASVVAVAEILAEMGHQFAPDDKDLHAAIGQYEFLRREYPGSKYRVEALFTIGQIYKDDLGDEAAAKATFEEFLKRYPHNQLSAKAQDALAELKQPKAKKKAELAAKATTAPATDADAPTLKVGASPRVTGIRYWSTADYTRVAIDLDSEVKYESGRVPDPDRIFFDLPDTKLVSTLVGKSFDVQDGFLKKIRVAQYQRGSCRVVLEVNDVSEYSAFLLPNPYRLIIDIHGKEAKAGTQVAANAPSVESATGAMPKSPATATSVPPTAGSTKSDPKPATPAKLEAATGAPAKAEPKATAMNATTPVNPAKSQQAQKPDTGGTKATGETAASTTTMAFKGASGELVAANGVPSQPPATKPSVIKTNATDISRPVPAFDTDSKPVIKEPVAALPAVVPAPEVAVRKGKKSSKTTAAAGVQSVHVAAPTSEGDRSLIRALGLKIGTIVVDAGHGGHDTGTIGPNGLLEKDLVLDVALRLGKLLESRLGAELIYTRDDDTFIPLETRTAIANEHRADMFISVHANSSRDESARGVETYYLNFTTNADALEVAARENAVSEKSVYELQDLVKKITLKDKIEESRELAGDVQASLYAGLSPKNPTLRNRGVKKAPFVVLIGANMPSILAEISFVSNPTDEKKLETPEYREKIAESLYKGIAKYADGLSGVKVAAKYGKEAGK